MKRWRCVGCEERRDGCEKVAGLGMVCELCREVIDVVWETELERTRTAIAQAEAFLASMEST